MTLGSFDDAAGTEPDYRFLLANERSFLAWIRTALAVLAGGVLLGQIPVQAQWHRSLCVIAALLCLLAAGMSLAALVRWRANDRAMRLCLPLPRPREIPLLALCAGAMAVVVALLCLWHAV